MTFHLNKRKFALYSRMSLYHVCLKMAQWFMMEIIKVYDDNDGQRFDIVLSRFGHMIR